MKRFAYIILAAIVTLVSCTNLDEVWAELRDHEERIQKLEALCNKLNSNAEAIQTILTALEQNDYVTDVVKVVENGIEVGYSITFAKGGTVTIYHGSNGADGAAPKVSIRKAADGEYYWTSDGEWMTDDEGNMIPASVPEDSEGEYVTPLFRVAEGKWYVSVDNGNTWVTIQANVGQDDEETLFPTITFDDYFIYFTMSDGTSIRISNLGFEAPQFHIPSVCHKSKDEPIRILCFGSSWFLNTWWYINKITDNLGIDAVVHGYYMGHSQFDEWISFYNNELTPFAGSEKTRGSYRYVSEGGSDYTVSKHVTGSGFGDQEFRDAWYNDLISEDWDIIIFQQGAHQSVQWKYWENCDELASIIKRHCNPRTLIGFNNTWTPSITSSYLSTDSDGLCNKTLEGQKLWQTYNFYNCQRLMNITGIETVSPVGAMIYTLRRDASVNIDADDLCYDGLHLNHGLPMFAAACVLYETFVAPFYGVSIKECTWMPTAADQRGPFNNSVFRPISEEQRDLIYNYVRLSLSNRFGFNEPMERDVVIDTENYPTSGTLELIQHALSVVAGENYYIPSSSNNKRMTSSSTIKATGVFVPAGCTMTLSGITGLRFDYVYSTLPGPNSHNKNINTIGGVGTASDFVSANYFPYNIDGSNDSVSFTNNYGQDYFFAFSFAAPNKTDQRLVDDYTITWAITDKNSDGWTEVNGKEILNTMPQESGYVRSESGLVTEYEGYDWSQYDIKVTCRYGTNTLMYAGCFWGDNDTYLGGFWKSTGSAKIFTDVILTDDDLPQGITWSDVKKISLASTTLSTGIRHSKLAIRFKNK